MCTEKLRVMSALLNCDVMQKILEVISAGFWPRLCGIWPRLTVASGLDELWIRPR